MTLTRLDHVSILPHDPEPVVAFYGDVLGFEIVNRRTIDAMHMTIFDLKMGDDFIEVIQPHGAATMADGIKHIAFRSDDIETDFTALRERGAQMVHKSVQHFEGISFFFIHTPTGDFVEIIQYAD